MTDTNDKKTETNTDRSIPNVALIAICGILILAGTVQAVELNELRNDIEELPELVEQGRTIPIGTSSGANLDESLGSLPQMVGGC